SADLDACHGHVGPVLWDGEVREMYHYHLTRDYPYTVGCFVGDPVEVPRPGPPPPPGGGQQPPPPGGEGPPAVPAPTGPATPSP
ncbi:MAG: hypothetical protein ACRCZP_02310, partial [Phycicoccus sp.]